MTTKEKLTLILRVKEETARDFGVKTKDPTLWNTAMNQTHRKKSQIALYEEVLLRVVSEMDSTIHKSYMPYKNWLTKVREKIFVPKRRTRIPELFLDMQKILNGGGPWGIVIKNIKVKDNSRVFDFGDRLILNHSEYVKAK